MKFFRYTAYAEGISFLLLLGVAMPLKYFADMPMAVKVTGWVHGILFMAYLFSLLQVHVEKRWPISRSALAVLAALLPFGPFVFDAKYLRPVS